MKIGIIGTGNIGSILAQKLSVVGHDVRIANSRGVEGAKQVAVEVGAKAVDVYGAVAGMDVVILSIPFFAVTALPADLFSAVGTDVVLIDTGNYYPGMRDPYIPDIDNGMPESVWVSRQIGRPLIKEFNNVLAYTLAELGQPEGTPGRLAAAVAGDRARSKAIVMKLVNQTGFDPVDAGTLSESWRQQPCTPAYCCDYDAEAMRKALALAIPEVAVRIRDQMPEFFSKLGPNPTHADIVSANRATNSVINEP
ncbi:NAD(P)-binding domain-containing protein [Acetobacter indonesiensis]|uniref:NADPH-dependent F420 reductase n=1 Tax=Acetobacter indonesiensis TaxID=104101 RepID=UPI001F43E9FE|nr:NAD(P)-binding domain-containing protein [Acetobacter indonesiensis]MCG0995880.1 NAD(P)-binding domain-containing protein [Acetobacter indonesiensis]